MENRKYQILRDDEHKIEYHGKNLHRIQALRDIGDNVKSGDIGGYIENYDNLSQVGECWIGGNAKVLDNARVVGNALIDNEAVIRDKAKISDNACIRDEALVRDIAQVMNNAKVLDKASICSSAKVMDNATVMDNALVGNFSKVMDSAVVAGNAQIFDASVIRDGARVYGHAKIKGTAHIRDYAEVWDAVVKDDAIIMDRSEVYDDSVIGSDAVICGYSRIEGQSCIIGNPLMDDNKLRIMNLALNDHARINSFNDFTLVHNVANKYDIVAYHKSIPNPTDVNSEDFVKTLKNEDFVKISVQKIFPLHDIEFEGTFSEYLHWVNQEPNPITNDTYMEYIAVAQLINYKFKKIFLQQ